MSICQQLFLQKLRIVVEATMDVFCNIILIEVGIVAFCLIYDRWVDAIKVV